MQYMSTLAAFGAAVIFAMPIADTAVAQEATAEDISALAAEWDAAFNDKDTGRLASMYAGHGRVITDDGTVKVGPEDIENLFRGFIDSGFGQHEISVTTAEVKGDIGYLTGTWSGIGGDGNEYGGHLTNIFERQADGGWKSVVHIWN